MENLKKYLNDDVISIVAEYYKWDLIDIENINMMNNVEPVYTLSDVEVGDIIIVGGTTIYGMVSKKLRKNFRYYPMCAYTYKIIEKNIKYECAIYNIEKYYEKSEIFYMDGGEYYKIIKPNGLYSGCVSRYIYVEPEPYWKVDHSFNKFIKN